MDSTNQSLPEDPAKLKEIIAAMADNEQRYQQRIEHLEEYVRLLKNEIFGRKSEKRTPQDDKQFLLFNEAESAESEHPQQDKSTISVPAHSRGKKGRKPLPARGDSRGA